MIGTLLTTTAVNVPYINSFLHFSGPYIYYENRTSVHVN